MAGNGRLSPKRDEHTRQAIKVKQIVNLLEDCVINGTEITPARMKAAEILLRKALPDLSAVEQTNIGDQVSYLVQVPMQPKSSKEWEALAESGGKKEPRIDHKSDEVH
jgi:hypothetical protein